MASKTPSFYRMQIVFDALSFGGRDILLASRTLTHHKDTTRKNYSPVFCHAASANTKGLDLVMQKGLKESPLLQRVEAVQQFFHKVKPGSDVEILTLNEDLISVAFQNSDAPHANEFWGQFMDAMGEKRIEVTVSFPEAFPNDFADEFEAAKSHLKITRKNLINPDKGTKGYVRQRPDIHSSVA